MVITPEGKKIALYRSTFKSLEIASDFKELSIFAELNDHVGEKLSGGFFVKSHQ